MKGNFFWNVFGLTALIVFLYFKYWEPTQTSQTATAAAAVSPKTGSISGGCFVTMNAGNSLVVRGETVYLLRRSIPLKPANPQTTELKGAIDTLSDELNNNYEETVKHVDHPPKAGDQFYLLAATTAQSASTKLLLVRDSIDLLEFYIASRLAYTHTYENLLCVSTDAMAAGLKKRAAEVRKADAAYATASDAALYGFVSKEALENSRKHTMEARKPTFNADFIKAFMSLPVGVEKDKAWQKVIQEVGASSCQTDMDGKYHFASIQPGEYLLYASWRSSMNYIEWCVPVTVTAEQDARVLLDNRSAAYVWIRTN